MKSLQVGQSIALLRKKYGMTQLELANRLGVTDKAVSRWERGLGMPDTALLVKLSIILDVDVETLLEGNVAIDNIGWKGVLLLDYPNDIVPSEYVFTKRIIYIQLCYFLLAGVTNLLIIGSRNMVSSAKKLLKNRCCIRAEYEVCDSSTVNVNDFGKISKVKEFSDSYGIMLVAGFDLLYGKDFTKILRRTMNNSRKPSRLYSFEKKETSIFFFPKGTVNEEIKDKICLERGVFVIPAKHRIDLAEMANFIRVLELYQDEPFMDIGMIAERRHIKKSK